MSKAEKEKLKQSDTTIQTIYHEGKVRVFDKDSDSLWVDLEVNAYSRDSIVVNSTFNNSGTDSFILYKPLLPHDETPEDLFAVLNSKKLDWVDFLGVRSRERYIMKDSVPTLYIVPVLHADNFLRWLQKAN
jgi:hypothetical protein